MFNLDPGKLLVIGVVAIILLGPDRLPKVARQVGDAWRSFGDFRHRMEAEVRSNIPDLPSTEHLARLARSPSALLNHLGNMSSDEPLANTPIEADDAVRSIESFGLPVHNGEMSWVTADFTSDVEPSADPVAAPGSQSVVQGDATLN
jgi:sec-independent protein translocase protein TatB